MKKIFIALIAVCLLLAPTFYAYADVLIEPENEFYSLHRSQIVYLGRNFTPSGAEGSVPIKSEPGARGELARLQNGEKVYLQYSCLYEGEFWGFSTEHSGWLPIGQMLVLYDYVAFLEEYAEEFDLYLGNYEEIKEAGAVIAWPWPGADAPLWTITDIDAENFRVIYAYTDSEGREWGFVRYSYSSSNYWVCLSDPINRDIPVLNPAVPPSPWESETAHINIEKTAGPPLALIIGLVAAVAIGTAILIRVLWKPGHMNKRLLTIVLSVIVILATPLTVSADGVFAWPTADGSQSSAIEETPESTTADSDATGAPEPQDAPEPQNADGLDEDPDIGDLIITIVAVLIIVTTLSLTVYRRNKRL